MLGAVRDSHNNFQVVSWEHDADICVDARDMPRVNQLLPLIDERIYIDSLSAHVARNFLDIHPVLLDENSGNYTVLNWPELNTFATDVIFPLKKVQCMLD